ncbi:BatD family protein [Soonwooa sp.]|uniref:BatD family protein n=1 Tax=Soonwooa sp. TaxID=1938592 RepID=UPI00262A6CDC|nr:BatD family protein [Soonwooa sp.]
MKNFKYTFLLVLIIVIFPCTNFSSQIKKEKEFVWFVVQPEVELGKNIDFNVYFEDKPESISINAKVIDGLELTDGLDNVRPSYATSITDDNDKVITSFYKFYTYAKPTKLGRIDFPTITVKYKGKEYKSTPFHINVVDNICVNPNNVKVVWSTDKSKYKKGDSIKLSLYEYSKFSQTQRIHLPAKNVSLAGKDNQINLNVEDTLDNIAGIDDFEETLSKNFDIVNIDWNMSNFRQSMEQVGNENYVKTLIVELALTPKNKGTYSFGPSTFDYQIYKSNTDYFGKFTPNDQGSYTVTDKGASKLKLISNKASIDVE